MNINIFSPQRYTNQSGSQLSTSTILTGRSEEIDKVSAKQRQIVERGPIYADIRLEIMQDLLSEYSFEDFHFLTKNDSDLFTITKEQEKKQVKSFGLYKNGRSGACNDPYYVHIAPGGSS